jgi:predicted ATPase
MPGDASGFAEMLDGIARAGRSATLAPASSMLGMLADAQLRVGALTDAETTLSRARALASQRGERNWEAEMHVTDGELARAMGAPLDDVLARLRKAQAAAQELGALRSELCAAMAMARALRDAGDPAAARAELAPVYAKFTQSFGTPLLLEAKALLEELAGENSA